MKRVRLANTRILTAYAQKSPLSLMWHPPKVCLGRDIFGRHLENQRNPPWWASLRNCTKCAI